MIVMYAYMYIFQPSGRLWVSHTSKAKYKRFSLFWLYAEPAMPPTRLHGMGAIRKDET